MVKRKIVAASSLHYARAMTASMLCEQGRIHFYRDTSAYHKEHGGDNLDVLEDELCNWLPGHDSPDRMDAFVHGINYLQPDMKDTGTEMSTRAAAAQLFGSYYGG